MLLAQKRKRVHKQLKAGEKVTWKDDRYLTSYVDGLAKQVQDLEDSTHTVLEKNEQKDQIIKSLDDCQYKEEEFKHRLNELQRITDDFVFNDYSNIFKWVEIVNKEIEQILVKRAEETIEEWIDEFQNYGEVAKRYIKMTPIHEIKIRDRQLVMDPSVQQMRAFWYKRLNGIVSIICRQKRIESVKYDKGNRVSTSLLPEDEEESNFALALKSINTDIMKKANKTIESAIRDASSYISISGCQALWNVDFSKLYDKLEACLLYTSDAADDM